MKKRLVFLLATFVCVFALTACGGSKTESEEADGAEEVTEETTEEVEEEEEVELWGDFFQAEIPDTLSPDEYGTVFALDTNEPVIKIYFETDTAEELVASKLEMFADTHTRGEDLTIGDYTWLVVNSESTGGEKGCSLFMDLPDGEHALYIQFYGLAIDSPEVTTFLETFAIEDDAYNRYVAFRKEVNGE